MRKKMAVPALLIAMAAAVCVGSTRTWNRCGYDCWVLPGWFPIHLTAMAGVFLSVALIVLVACVSLILLFRRSDGA